MRKLLILATLGVLLAPAAAQAHPLGNLTVNRFARVEVAGDRLYVRYVLDLAEIPTFQAQQQGVEPAAYARRLAAGLRVTLDGHTAALTPVAHALAFPKGVGGLHTLRLQVILAGLLGTVLVNLLRISAVGVLVVEVGRVPAQVFHDYGGTLLVMAWLFGFWAVANSWLLRAGGGER